MDVFAGLEAVEAYVGKGCIQHHTEFSAICPVCLSMRAKAREGIEEVRRVVELCASDTTAADLRQEIEFMKAEAEL